MSPRTDKEWDALVLELKCAEHPEKCLNQAALSTSLPPVGMVTRALLLAWANASEPLSGGNFSLHDVYRRGFFVSGPRDQPFLSRVLGDQTNKELVFADLIDHEPQRAIAVLQKLVASGKRADSELPNVKNFGGPVLAKQMVQVLLTYSSELGKEAEGILALLRSDDNPFNTTPANQEMP